MKNLLQKNLKALIPLFVVIGGFIVVGVVLIRSGFLPEESAKQFHSLSNVSIQSSTKILQQPNLQNNVLIYAVNDVAKRGIDIVQNDTRIQQILSEAKARKAAVTIAAVQPTVMVDSQSGQLMHSSGGQVVITANWQMINGAPYLEPKTFGEIANQRIESHQQIWNVLVDVDKGQITDLSQIADRVVTDTIRPDIVRADMNMFVPNAAVVKQGSVITWPNLSNMPHNVVGVFNETTGSSASPGGKANNSTSGIILKNPAQNSNNNSTNARTTSAIDSGFIQPNNSWHYRFDKVGIFNFICTIHSEEGMRGTIVVTPS